MWFVKFIGYTEREVTFWCSRGVAVFIVVKKWNRYHCKCVAKYVQWQAFLIKKCTKLNNGNNNFNTEEIGKTSDEKRKMHIKSSNKYRRILLLQKHIKQCYSNTFFTHEQSLLCPDRRSLIFHPTWSKVEPGAVHYSSPFRIQFAENYFKPLKFRRC